MGGNGFCEGEWGPLPTRGVQGDRVGSPPSDAPFKLGMDPNWGRGGAGVLSSPFPFPQELCGVHGVMTIPTPNLLRVLSEEW